MLGSPTRRPPRLPDGSARAVLYSSLFLAIPGGIVVPLHAGATRWATGPADGYALGDQHAHRQVLNSAGWCTLEGPPPLRDRRRLPCRSGWSSMHSTPHREGSWRGGGCGPCCGPAVLIRDGVVGANKRRLMGNVLPLPFHLLRRLGEQDHRLATAGAPVLAARDTAVGRLERAAWRYQPG